MRKGNATLYNKLYMSVKLWSVSSEGTTGHRLPTVYSCTESQKGEKMGKCKRTIKKMAVFSKRALSVLLTFAMVLAMVQMLPENLLTARAEEGVTNITIHYYNDDEWAAPAVQYWGGSGNTVVTGDNGSGQINGWGAGDTGYKMTDEADGWYSLTLKGDFTGFQFLNFEDPSGGTSPKSGYSGAMTQYHDAAPQDLYYRSGSWYTNKECSIPMPDLESIELTLHYYDPNNWGEVCVYSWTSGMPSEWGSSWPGAMMTAETDKAGWYTITAELTNVTSFDFNVNNNNKGKQTENLYASLNSDSGNVELWIVGAIYDSGQIPASMIDITTTAPESWTNSGTGGNQGDVDEPIPLSLTLHYYDPNNWGEVCVYSWTSGMPSEWGSSWPGAVMTAETDKAGWYTITAELTNVTSFDFNVNNNNKGKQTEDLHASLNSDSGNIELWIVGAIYDSGNIPASMIDVTTTAPESWTNSGAGSSGNIGDIKVTDRVQLIVDGNTVDMQLYLNGIYETGVSLAAGTYDAGLKINGVDCGTKSVTVSKDGTVYFRVQEGQLKDSESEKIVHTAAFTGNFYGLEFVDDGGERYDIGNWDPADAKAELAYLGGGLYKRTFKFNELNSDVVGIEYKVAFDDGWDYSIPGSNIAVTIPAGRTSITVLVDEINGIVYDDVRTEDFTVAQNSGAVTMNALNTTVSLVGDAAGSWDTGIIPERVFTQISDSLFIYQKAFDAGTYNYKCLFNGYTWYEAEPDNRTFTLTGGTNVIFIYNTETGRLYDTVNNAGDVAVMLGMEAAPPEMEVVNNANGTTTFTALGEDGAAVTLYYAYKAEAEASGEAAFTEVKMPEVANGVSRSDALFLGDDALDIVYYYVIDGVRTTDSSNPTVKIGDVEYSNYTRAEFKGRLVAVPGTFPGPSWDAASNVMTYEGNGLYSYTFKNVPAANYEFKIAMGSWSENYGVDGIPDGANISVTVPVSQDVTIWYNDFSHHAVNSIDYSFVDLSIVGTGIPEGTKLTDNDLTGIYSVKVHLNAGVYSDVKIVDNDTKEETAFAPFELTEEKDVTFYYDPATGIKYHDASDAKVDTANIHYDSKDQSFKSVYGAVATGEKVTFSIKTGVDATEVLLVIKGKGSEALSKAGASENGVQKWSAAVSFDTIGEYAYYFAVSNGSSLAIYGDDDGYYGTGTVTDLTSVKPYDLVVYKSGYETPDWMKNAVIYQIFPDRFFDGNEENNDAQVTARGVTNYEYITDWYVLPENPEQKDKNSREDYEATGAYWGDGEWSNEIYGGDFEGIIQRIDYLKALGVNVIYLNPVFSSISSHRYDASDYTVIDPILGDLGDFKDLVAVAEENDMHIILDGVFNHVSDDSIYFDRYYKFLEAGTDTIGAYPYWAYVYDYMAEKSVSQIEAETAAKTYFADEYGINDFSYTEWFEVYTSFMTDGKGNEVTDAIGLRAGKPVYGYEGWWGYDSMPVIKSTNGSEYQSGNWAEKIIDGKDSVTQYWISQGSNGWRLDVANEVSDETWQHFRQSVKALDSGAVIIGEIWDDATKYLLGDMYDSVMNYVFRNAVTGFAKGGDASDTTKELERLRERYPKEAFYAMMNLVASHDTTRILSYLDGIPDDRENGNATLKTAFPTYEGTSDLAKKRQYLVAFLQFTYAGAPTVYYGDEIGMVGADDPDDRRAFTWGKGNQEIVEWYATLAAIRNSYSALRTGSVEVFETGSQNVMGYVRRDAETAMVVLANNSQNDMSITLNLSELNITASELADVIDLTCETVYAVSDTTATVTVPALSGAVLTDKANVKTVTVDKDGLVPAYDESYAVEERSIRRRIPVSGEAGFQELEYTLDQVDDGTVTAVLSQNATEVPEGVFNALKGKDVTLVFEVNYGKVRWTIYGKDIDNEISGPIDLGVTVIFGGSENIPAEKLKELAGNQTYIGLELAYDGEFGFGVTLVVYVGTEYYGREASLYYYNENSTGELELQGTYKVDANGEVAMPFTHASDYVILLNKMSTPTPPAPTPGTSGEVITTSDNQTTAVQPAATGDRTPISIAVIVLLSGGVLVAVAVIRRKRISNRI